MKLPHQIQFQVYEFENYCNILNRIGIDPGYLMYTNHHASNDKPSARQISTEQLHAAKAYIDNPTDENFIQLVKLGVLFDNEWDRKTSKWMLISFDGWEVLHKAFTHLLMHCEQSEVEMTGVSNLTLT